jgi:hypothetical protein
MVMRYSHLAPEHQASAVDRLVKAEKRRDTKADTSRRRGRDYSKALRKLFKEHD